MNDTLQNTAEWFRQATPSPTTQNQSTQMGVHFEEVREMVQELTPRTPEAKAILEAANNALDNLQALLKRDATAIGVHPSNYKNFLDSLCDQIVTATGTGVLFGMDVPGAQTEVNASNWSKFVDGKPVRDPDTQKILKGPLYFKPDLTKYLPQ